MKFPQTLHGHRLVSAPDQAKASCVYCGRELSDLVLALIAGMLDKGQRDALTGPVLGPCPAAGPQAKLDSIVAGLARGTHGV